MSRRRTAFTLLEMLAVMAMVTMLLSFGVTLLLTAMRTDQAASALLRDLSRHAELADQFRADVAGADSAPEHIGDVAAGPNCLILRAGRTNIIYRWVPGKLTRSVRGDGPETRRPVAVDPEDTTVEFVRGAGARPLITARVIQSRPRAAARTTEISAALGGDVR